jgi:predicted acetyltransferase/GrpB-like predicted nucleotidyltransferase (UPF0157 family)
MSPLVFFHPVSLHREKAEALFVLVEEQIRSLVPAAMVEHVGSTSLPDGLSKGDLDVQVRVRPEDYDDACRKLASAYEDNPGGFTDGGRSFKDDAAIPPLGVHVTVIDGPSDLQHRQRDLLRSRADLRTEYDALKRAFDGRDMDAYREAKSIFFARLAAEVSASDPRPPTGRTTLRPAAAQEREVLENLVQLYSYDWSELTPLDVGDDGRFKGIALAAYWLDEWRHPLLLRVDETLAGFALVVQRSRLTGRSDVFDMAEFFVMRRFRRQGVGLAAAFAAFDRFRGPWEVRQRDENAAATTFWRRAIDRYTHGHYQETRWSTPEWTGAVQTFSTE